MYIYNRYITEGSKKQFSIFLRLARVTSYATTVSNARNDRFFTNNYYYFHIFIT